MLRNRYFVIYAIVLPMVYYLIFSLSSEPEYYAYLLIAMLVFSLLSGAVTTFAIGLAYDNSRTWRTSMKALPVSELVVSGAKLTSQLLLNSVTVVILNHICSNDSRAPWQYRAMVYDCGMVYWRIRGIHDIRSGHQFIWETGYCFGYSELYVDISDVCCRYVDSN